MAVLRLATIVADKSDDKGEEITSAHTDNEWDEGDGLLAIVGAKSGNDHGDKAGEDVK